MLDINKYQILPEFIPRAKASLLAERFSMFCERNKLGGDNFVRGAPAFYNYLGFAQILVEKTLEVSKIVREPVLPTYSYARVYSYSHSFPRHRDRPACELSLSVHLGGDQQWPMYMQLDSGEVVSINLNVGDAVIYYGTEIDHWRDPYEGDRYVQAFFHYVKSNGKFSHLMFDSEHREEAAILKYIQHTNASS